MLSIGQVSSWYMVGIVEYMLKMALYMVGISKKGHFRALYMVCIMKYGEFGDIVGLGRILVK